VVSARSLDRENAAGLELRRGFDLFHFDPVPVSDCKTLWPDFKTCSRALANAESETAGKRLSSF
jgi:hypothetical protein